MPDLHERSRLTRALLRLPAPHAVRVIATGLLDDVRAAQARFDDDEADALHDLRVAIRRLRSWLRAFRPELSDTVRGRTRRRLHALATATNEARDAEVALAFIERQTALPARARAAVRAMAGELAKSCQDHARDMRRTVRSDLPKTARALASQLESWWECHRIGEHGGVRPMSVVFADAIRHQARRTESALAHLDAASKADDIHRARIAAKRLRYLLEPLGEDSNVAEPIRMLRTIQQQLGDARDAHRIAARFVRDIGERAARDARGRALAAAGIVPGDDDEHRDSSVGRATLTELARRAHAARDAAYDEYAAQWGQAELAALAGRIDAIAERQAEG